MKLLTIMALLGAAARAEEVLVTVYNRADVPFDVLQAASDNVERIFRHSKIDVRIVIGPPQAVEASQFNYSAAAEPDAACRARRDIALRIIEAPPGLKPSILGIAQPLASAGINAGVFAGNVRAAAERSNRPFDILLAHAIAHEVGHVLLRDGLHTSRGLMAGAWTQIEYDWMKGGLLFFSSFQSERMRSNLRGDGCSVNPVVAQGTAN